MRNHSPTAPPHGGKPTILARLYSQPMRGIALAAKGRRACAASVRTLPNEQATLDLGQFFMPRGASLVDPARCLACCGGRPSTTSTRTQRVSRRSLPTRSTPSATTASPSRGGPSWSFYCYEGVAPSPKLLHAIVAWPGSSSPRADVVDANVTVSSRAWAPVVISPVACQLVQPVVAGALIAGGD